MSVTPVDLANSKILITGPTGQVALTLSPMYRGSTATTTEWSRKSFPTCSRSDFFPWSANTTATATPPAPRRMAMAAVVMLIKVAFWFGISGTFSQFLKINRRGAMGDSPLSLKLNAICTHYFGMSPGIRFIRGFAEINNQSNVSIVVVIVAAPKPAGIRWRGGCNCGCEYDYDNDYDNDNDNETPQNPDRERIPPHLIPPFRGAGGCSRPHPHSMLDVGRSMFDVRQYDVRRWWRFRFRFRFGFGLQQRVAAIFFEL